MEIIYPTTAPLLKNTLNKCFKQHARHPMGNGDYIPYCGGGLGENFHECLERRAGFPMGNGYYIPTAAPVWGSTFDECLERRA